MSYVFGILFVGCFVWLFVRKSMENYAAADKLKKYVKCDWLNHTLIVYTRSSELCDAISIHEDRNTTVTRVPDKLVFTSATVGGVTTGGFHVEEGGARVNWGSKNGKFLLWYKYAYPDTGSLTGWSGATMDEVRLSSEDFEDARKRFPYLDIAKTQYTGEEKENTLNLRNIYDRDKLQSFISWLCVDG